MLTKPKINRSDKRVNPCAYDFNTISKAELSTVITTNQSVILLIKFIVIIGQGIEPYKSLNSVR